MGKLNYAFKVTLFVKLVKSNSKGQTKPSNNASCFKDIYFNAPVVEEYYSNIQLVL